MTRNKISISALTAFVASAAVLFSSGCSTTQAASQPQAQSQATTTAPVRSKANTMAFPTGDRATSAILLEKQLPAQIFQGRDFSYDMVITNLTGLSLEDVRVSEKLPENFTLSNSSPYQPSTEGGQTVWTIPSIAPHGSVTITVNGVANSGTQFASCADVTYRSVLCAAAPIVSPDITLGVSLASVTDTCSATPIVYTVTNNGTATLNNVVLTPAIPAGLQVVGGDKSFNLSQLAPGASQSFTVNVKPSASGSYAVTPSVSTAEGVSAQAQADTVAASPALAATATSPDQVLIVRTITYDVGVSNTGDATAGSTKVAASLPANADFVSATRGGAVSGGSVVWNVNSLSAGAGDNFSFTVKPRGSGDYTTNVTAGNDCAGTASARSTTRVVGIPALLLEVVDKNDPVAVGDNVTYEIVVTNQGSAPAHNVKIHVELEDNETYVSSTGDTSNVTGQTVDFTPVTSIEVGGKVVYQVVVRANAAGDTRFHVEMTSDELKRPVTETESTNLY